MRAVVDTNIWISAILKPSGFPSRIVTALRREQFVLVSSQPLLAELTEVLARPRLINRYQITPTDIAELIALIHERAEIVNVTGQLRLSRGSDDDVLIETAVAGDATLVVTRDDDLKGLSDMSALLDPYGVMIVSVSRFLTMLADQGNRR